ncbi:TonB-dependent receptor [uncultured Sphingomonas sp.]|uniref:TonB-dependent receptor n=1 Tax=uncultured Sphingomonas sp. TaxID=158754 RepID=UPI0035C97FB4
MITGVRQSLANAQSIKRNSDTVVDAITAEDIGALPDRSVNEALQRVPGVAISRFAAPNDSQHYSAQGSGVVIRGLSYVRGEFNGRDAFAAGGGREIGFNDIPSEIVGSIEVFKNLTADLIEGGISGTVNINTRKPFDSDKDLIFLSGGVNYGDLERRASPQGVALLSKQVDVGGGRFGILGSVTYQQTKTRSDSVFTASFLPRSNDDTNGNGVQDTGEGRTINAGTPYAATVFDRFPVPTGFNRVYVPLGAGSRSQDFDRERIGYSGAVQYENADRSFLVTGQFLRAESTEDWIEHTVEPNNYYNDVTAIFPAPGTNFTFDDDGIFTSGILTKPNNGDAQGFRPDGSYGLLQFDPNGGRITQSNRHFYSKSVTQDQSINVKWSPTERLHLNFDGQYVTSDVKVMDDILDTSTFAGVSLDLRNGTPQIGFTVPSTVPGGGNANAYFANPDQLYFRDAFNGRQENDGDEWAFRADAQYDVSEDGFLRSLKVGGRYADRQQTVRSVDYTNWGNLSETWGAAGPVTFADAPNSGQLYNFTDFFRGKANTPPSAFFVSNDVLRDHDTFTNLLRDVTAQGGGSYCPVEDGANIGGRAGGVCSPRVNGRSSPNATLINGLFQTNEVFVNSEKTYAAYARVDFGIDDFGNGMGLSGNIGVRYVNTRDRSVGGITYPNQGNIFPADNNRDEAGNALPARYVTLPEYCSFTAANAAATGSANPPPSICTITPAQQNAVLAFSNAAIVPETVSQKFDHWLPSLNVKLQLTPTLLVRGAASQAISRPAFGDLRNFIGVGPSGGNSTGNYSFQTGRVGNPLLRPIEATQFDLTAEWYFGKVGSLTGAVFHKTLDNIILDNFGYNRPFSNNGQTFDVTVTGPANVSGKAKIKGVEVAYQQTYDFLPGILRGLGLQTTYTYVQAGRIPNGVPRNAQADGDRPPLDVGGIYDNLPLQGLSKHNVNVSGFYDLGKIYARVAYSWRSKFLLTNRDCCFPFLPVYALPTGQMDASLFLTVNKNFKLGITGSNLLDETTKTNFLLNGDGLEAPRSFFKNDRTFTLTARLTY